VNCRSGNLFSKRAEALLPGSDLDPARDHLWERGHLRQTLAVELTAPLLSTVPAAFHAGVDDVLLTALAISVGRPILIDVEGHGREAIDTGFDLSRTVGWSPVSTRLSAPAGRRASVALSRSRSKLHRVPGKGLGYGLLRSSIPKAAIC